MVVKALISTFDQMLAVQNKNSANFVEWIPNNVKVPIFISNSIELDENWWKIRWPSAMSPLVAFPWLPLLLAIQLLFRCHQIVGLKQHPPFQHVPGNLQADLRAVHSNVPQESFPALVYRST